MRVMWSAGRMRRERWARHVAAEPLEAAAVACGNRDVRVKTHAPHARAALVLEERESLDVDAIAAPKHAPSGARPCCDSPGH